LAGAGTAAAAISGVVLLGGLERYGAIQPRLVTPAVHYLGNSISKIFSAVKETGAKQFDSWFLTDTRLPMEKWKHHKEEVIAAGKKVLEAKSDIAEHNIIPKTYWFNWFGQRNPYGHEEKLQILNTAETQASEFFNKTKDAFNSFTPSGHEMNEFIKSGLKKLDPAIIESAKIELPKVNPQNPS
jgi:hypothetical protein